MYANEDLIDSRLCEEGIEQCVVAGRQLAETNIRAIIVSPMRRTLETAYYLFKDHKNFNTMDIVLHPMLREKITIARDVPLRNKDYSKELSEVY